MLARTSIAALIVAHVAGCTSEQPAQQQPAQSGDTHLDGDTPAGDTIALGDDVAGDPSGGDTTGATQYDHQSYIPDALDPANAARLLVIGNSISSGYGQENPQATAYPYLLFEDPETGPFAEPDADLTSLFGTSLIYRQAALDGGTSTDLRQRLLDDGDLQQLFEDRDVWPATGHTIVVMNLAGNDFGSGLLGDLTGAILDDVINNLIAFIDFLQDPANFPDGTSIYVATVYDPSDGEDHASNCLLNITIPGIAAGLETWRERFIAVATEKEFAVIDSLGHFRGHGWNFENSDNPHYDSEDPSLWFLDCVHPNERGHHELRRLFFEAISGAYVVE